MMTPLDRLRARTSVDSNGCWVSDLGITTAGYSQVSVNFGPCQNRLVMAHVLAWEELIGPVPEGQELDHACRNRACWNVMHLEPVTHGENVKRGRGAAFWRDKMHCPRGHEYTPENTRVRPQSMGRPGTMRECRACGRERAKRSVQ